MTLFTSTCRVRTCRKTKNALLSEDVVVKNAATIDVNVPSRLFAASVYHNGVLFTSSAQQQGNILLRNPDSGDLVFFGKTSLQNLSARVVPGAYDVYYSHLNGEEVPQNRMARFHEDLVVTAPSLSQKGGGGAQLHVNSIQITGQMLMNDSPMPVNEYDDGLLSHSVGGGLGATGQHPQPELRGAGPE